MEKLKMETKNLADENYKKLAELFPNAITETIDSKGNIVRAIDKDVLMQEININIVEGKQERYQFTWPDKRKSVVLANAPTTKTLRFLKNKSVGRDGTPGGTDSENIYIEGDNLDALKLIQETYLGKVKMIYIDPPYNTGSDFIYNDNYYQSIDNYKNNSGQIDDSGNLLVQNSESNGRFHTDWLNMIYPRLRIAKSLLKKDGGIIFISIDDNEVNHLKMICDEIFSESNYVATFTWIRKKKGSFLSNSVRKMTEYILCYKQGDLSTFKFYGEKAYSNKMQPIVKRTNAVSKLFMHKGIVHTKLPDGIYEKGFKGPSGTGIEFLNDFKVSNGLVIDDLYLKGHFTWSQNYFNNEIRNGSQVFLSTKFGFNVLKHDQENKIKTPSTLINSDNNVGTNEDATLELQKLFDLRPNEVFSYSKPTSLIEYLINMVMYDDDDGIVVDFFSGSATTANAINCLNSKTNSSRKFILIQLPEKIDDKSTMYTKGFKTICDFGEERIRRSAKKIKEETNANIDYGFRCFKIDSSNMKDVYYSPKEYNQTNLQLFEDNIKPDRTSVDLLIQVMLDLGIMLSSKIDKITINNNEVFSVENGYLYACFDKSISEETVKQIALKHPFYAIFRDLGMENDSVMTNFDQIFKTYSPNTKRRVI